MNATQIKVRRPDTLAEVCRIFFDPATADIVIRPVGQVYVAMCPHSVGYKWDEDTEQWREDWEIIFNGTPTAAAVSPATGQTDIVINVVNSIKFKLINGLSVAELRWLPASQQATQPYVYQGATRDVVEFRLLDELTGLVITGRGPTAVGAEPINDTRATLKVTGGVVTYPF
jgi:hypothetical protein